MKIKLKHIWSKNNIDQQVKFLITEGRVSPVAWWLMCSYAYYVLDKNLLEDETFDWIGHYLQERWDTIQHPNKRLIRRNATFSGYYVKSYPLRCKVATWRLLEQIEGK